MDQTIDIEARMISFLETQDHVRPLDGHVDQPINVKMADYLFFHGRAVTELKTLKIDPKEKILSQAKPAMDSGDFPLIFGDYDLEAAIKAMPDGQATMNRIFAKATTVVEGICRQARDQIASSKKHLGLDPETPGILLVLNEAIESIPVAQLVDRFSFWLEGGIEKRSDRFSQIDFVVLIQTTYRVKAQQGQTVPAFIIYNECNSHRHHLIERDVHAFLKSWAHSQGHRYATAHNVQSLKFEPNQPTPPLPQTTQEYVEHRYRQNRYLQELTEEEFIQYGCKVTGQMTSIVLIGGPKPSDETAMLFMTRFGEFLEECRLRSFDLKKVTSRMRIR
ncbi:hypothetical protein FGE05_10810 [Pseudomonas sp. ICMP22404]|uniref:hypothetical protein n=1 Tax=Pseudomonas sp. ICMP22404 TaxID=2583807 RepID=UPI001118DE01|nr:hypothetical protein [Pseudomonas sp. ICMP22404]TNF82792.1 hypothetical protein FGE05_10810 [Pseudomonas sp. ICMP22404]